MRFLPLEHGLTITWIATVLLSVVMARTFSIFGLILLILILPTISLYDTLLSSLRISRVKSASFLATLNKSLELWKKGLLLAIGALIASGLYMGSFPALALFFPLLSLISFFIASRSLNERSVISRSLSLLPVTSQFVLLNSALTGVLSILMIREFIILTLINIMLAAGAVEIVNSKIGKTEFRKNFSRVNLPLFLISGAVLYFSTIDLPYEFILFLSVFAAATASFLIVSGKPMKMVGMSSSAWNLLTAVFLMAFYFI